MNDEALPDDLKLNPDQVLSGTAGASFLYHLPDATLRAGAAKSFKGHARGLPGALLRGERRLGRPRGCPHVSRILAHGRGHLRHVILEVMNFPGPF
eukprot:scaffold7068_cov301-Pinguiococcus_pyrenoidosus.AAC.9